MLTSLRQALGLECKPLIFGAILASTLLATACSKKAEPAKPAPVKADDKAEKIARPGAGTKADCDDWAKRLCSITGGDATPTCGSIKTTIKLVPPAACKVGLGDMEYSKKAAKELDKACDELVAKLCGDLGKETQTCKMVQTRTKQFGAAKCQQMMKDYPKVLAQLQRMEAANKPLTADKMAAITADGAAEFGNKTSKVVLVEFSDFQCPYCGRAAKATQAIKKKYGSKIRFVFRQFPLSFHQHAHLAAEAALAAKAQGKFWEMHDKMFGNQRALERSDLEKYAKEIGLDIKKFKDALDKHSYKDAVDADIKLGGTVAVQGTPTLFINGKRAQNASDAASIGREIDTLLAK